MRRTLIAALVSVCALAAPAAALALGPGEVGAEAYTRMDAETFARDSSLQKSDFWRETIAGATSASSSYRWPPPSPFGDVLFTCPSTGCAGYDGRAFGSADIGAGLLKAAATARLYVGNEPADGYGLAGYIFSDGWATIADTITLSQPATVILRGSVEGTMGGSADTDQQPSPDAQLQASFLFTGESDCGTFGGEGCGPVPLGGYEQTYAPSILNCPGADGTCFVGGDGWVPISGESVANTFEVAVTLPAGTSSFTAKLRAAVDFQVYGTPGVLESSRANLDFSNSARFEIVVPDDVIVTSGSGMLPVVGGSSGGDGGAEPPADTELPVLELPGALTGEATSPAGAVVDYTAGATDELDASPSVSCTPASGSTFPLGATSVSCTATDAAGNSAAGSFTVRVVDTTAPALSLAKLRPELRVYEFVGTTALLPAEAADLVDPSPAVVCTPAAGERLPVGRTLVVCTATDAAGNTATASITVTVLGPAQILFGLVEAVRAAGLSPATEEKLLSRLEQARLALEKTRIDQAETALESFVGEVEKQSRKGGIGSADAVSFLELAGGLVRGLFPRSVMQLAEKVGRLIATMAPLARYVPGVGRVLELLGLVEENAGAGKFGAALAKLREAEDELAALKAKGLVASELADAVERDMAALEAALSGSPKG